MPSCSCFGALLFVLLSALFAGCWCESNCPGNTKSIGEYCACLGTSVCRGPRCARGQHRITGSVLQGYHASCADCVCESKRHLVLCISLPRSGSTALSHLVKAYGESTFAFVEPCRWAGLHTCDLSAFRRCEVFDWPRAQFYQVFWAYACDFVGDILPGFRKRCSSKSLTQQDISLLKRRCLSASTIFIKFIAHNSEVVEQLLPRVNTSDDTTVFILLRNVSSTVQSMYAAEMQWYSRQPKFRTPFALLATNFCQANQVLLREQQSGALTVDYTDLSLEGIDRVLTLIGITPNPKINENVLGRKFLSLSQKEFPFPWDAMECRSYDLQQSLATNCSLATTSQDSCHAACVCVEKTRNFTVVASIAHRPSAALARIFNAHARTFVFLSPCAGLLPTACNFTDFRSCGVFDWPLARFSAVFTPAMCSLLGDISPGFIVRCKRQRLIGRDFGLLRQRCAQATTVVVVAPPELALAQLRLGSLTDDTRLVAVQSSLRNDIELAWVRPSQRDSPLVVASVVCSAHTALRQLAVLAAPRTVFAVSSAALGQPEGIHELLVFSGVPAAEARALQAVWRTGSLAIAVPQLAAFPFAVLGPQYPCDGLLHTNSSTAARDNASAGG